MDAYEASSLVYAKIKNLEPENASKIMGFLLIQDLGDKELIRLAFGPETLLHSLILKAKAHLGFSLNSSSSSSSTPSSPSPLNPIARPSNTNPFSQSKNPSSSPSSTSSWSFSGITNNVISPKSTSLLSYDCIRAPPFSMPPFLQHKNGFGDSEVSEEPQVNDYLSFLNESSSSRGEQNWSQSMDNAETPFHRRSYSASDVCFGSEDGGFGVGYKPCLYFARGFCKNGSNCKFLHGDFPDLVDPSAAIVGSPSKLEGLFDQREEFMRYKAAQQQRLATASEFMAGVSPSQYNKYINFLLQQQNETHRATAAALMMGDEYQKFGISRNERNDFLALAAEKRNSASRQIYLTFPADSTFKDEDVSEYFSKFGPVQDVRIPYQQKRMFGFVTFVYPETVKHILAKGNPHFICESRVLVKPYKEKGKVPEKRQQHQQPQLERGDFSPCLSPSGLDARDPYDLNLGARMMYNTQGMMLRRKLEEQAELQQALELQGRRLLNLQLPDLKNDQLHHHHPHNLPICSPLSTESHNQMNQNIYPPDFINQEASEGHENNQVTTNNAMSTPQNFQLEENPCFIQSKATDDGYNSKLLEIHKSVEQVLPDSPFASPKKSASSQHPDFSSVKADGFGPNTLPSSSQSNASLATGLAGDIAAP
ncbi:zinc finger CCCH domain-containing protein 55 [Cucurbita moschata]|uniref:Zinc finger CCCH domain-containing protein 55 n=1 Tax=Cucurbita moschata TaxID=3662 RepID=A0A6J1EQS0_CUCMO|nr:zinc finger CCCH domain-containing protein 55 [Cucurbita moschata]XP_022930505.1 zinc finger CCCH domain-containing protein 55 [Cucurbita moschata]XP_022930513.1 zinc finger CCCH domain-containing protein 55 [Cucurbita moschata]XP_022930522.1 zinc finger CCCH domain-containing protein 55 [Cucurbita moschata]